MSNWGDDRWASYGPSSAIAINWREPCPFCGRSAQDHGAKWDDYRGDLVAIYCDQAPPVEGRPSA